jgi:hypothetical membrane protein
MKNQIAHRYIRGLDDEKKQPLSFITGILGILCYLLFTVLAYSHYPLPYSPTTNWLSDLGNPNYNPQGAIFYNIGIISTALLMMLFFLGLSVWKIEGKRVQIIMLLLAQVFGILGALCMILSAIFPINIMDVHSFWSTSLYIMLSTGFVFLADALRYNQKVPTWLIILGISTAPMVIIWSFFKSVYLLEWITLLIFLSFVGLVGVEAKVYRNKG